MCDHNSILQRGLRDPPKDSSAYNLKGETENVMGREEADVRSIVSLERLVCHCDLHYYIHSGKT